MMDLDEAFDLIINRSRQYWFILKQQKNRNCPDDQSALSAFDTAINIIEEHWDQLP